MTPIQPSEPIRGSTVHDNTGERWWRGDQGWSRIKAHPDDQLPGVLSWRELNDQHGPVTLSLTPRDLGEHVMVTTDPARNHGSPSITRMMVPIWSPMGLLLAGDTAETVRSEFDLTDGETAMLVAFTADLRGLLAEHAQEQQGGVDAAGDDKPLPIPNVAYVVGVHTIGDGYHAVAYGDAIRADEQRGTYAGSACGVPVFIARRMGEYRRGNPELDRVDYNLCPECAWAVALHRGTEDAELDAITPTGAELDALRRHMLDPLITVRLCRRILQMRRRGDQWDDDHEIWAEWLGLATAHRPHVLICEDGCGHETDDECAAASDAVACLGCSYQAGMWAGEWAGQVQCPVPPTGAFDEQPSCAVLPSLVTRVVPTPRVGWPW